MEDRHKERNRETGKYKVNQNMANKKYMMFALKQQPDQYKFHLCTSRTYFYCSAIQRLLSIFILCYFINPLFTVLHLFDS